MIWHVDITLNTGEAHHLISGTEIRFTSYEATQLGVVVSEHDTLVIPLQHLTSIHIYRLGSTL